MTQQERFYIDHGMIHDRETGKHVTTDEDSVFCDGRIACCELLNALQSERDSRDRRIAELEAALAVCRQSLVEQAQARTDPTMPLIKPEVVRVLREESEVRYACADDQHDRIVAHGLSLLCDWQDRSALKPGEKS